MLLRQSKLDCLHENANYSFDKVLGTGLAFMSDPRFIDVPQRLCSCGTYQELGPGTLVESKCLKIRTQSRDVSRFCSAAPRYMNRE